MSRFSSVTPLNFPYCFSFFFFNDTATTEIYTLSLHDALPIFHRHDAGRHTEHRVAVGRGRPAVQGRGRHRQCADSETEGRSEEHTSELQSPCNLVCRLLLEKKKKEERLVVTDECHKIERNGSD